MERITYRITLDTHRTGIQRTLQGFEIGNNMSRRISMNLMASGDTFEIPFDHVTAMMYVLPQGAKEPSINECVIEGNTIIYDVLPTDIATEGITEMQVKLIEGRTDGARKVLVSPKFALEVSESNIDDESVESTTTFTALEEAVAKAEGVYNSRLVSVEITDDYNFRAYYADGTYYETDALYEALHNGNALLAQSYAKGGTGIREGEDADNSMYYAGVARSASAGVNMVAEESKELLDEARLQTAYTAFNVNFETGNLDYASANYTFDVNEETGDLEAESNGSYVPEQIIGGIVNDYLDEKTAELDQKIEDVSADFNEQIAIVDEKADTATNIAKGRNQAHVFSTTAEMQEWLSNADNKGLLNKGDNIYIEELEVPDWWIAEVLEKEDTETGYYYKIAQLETQKVDLTNYLSKDTVLDTMEEIEANKQENKPAGALALKELSLKISDTVKKIRDTMQGIASGNSIHVDDSKEAPAIVIPYGNTEQDTTSGKNLLDCSGLTTKTTNGVTFTPVYADNGELEYINVNGTATAYTRYQLPYFSWEANVAYIVSGGTSGSASTCVFGMHDVGTDNTGKGVTLNKTEAGRKYCFIDVASGYTANNLKFYPMIRLATITDGTYEPFTNGASPNPSYPQEIKSVVLSEIKTCGKNLFGFGKSAVDVTAELRPTYTQRLRLSSVDDDTNKIKCAFNGGNWSFGYVEIAGVDGTKDYAIRFDVESNTTEYTPTIRVITDYSDNSKLVLQIGGGNGTDVVANTEYFILSNIQIELGTTATEYKPYTESVATLSNTITMNGLNGVWDDIKRGVLIKRFKKVVLSSSMNWKVMDASSTLGHNVFYTVLSDYNYIGGNTLNYMCTHLAAISHNERYKENTVFMGSNKWLVCCPQNYTTLDAWKAYLDSNTVTVTYELAEPIETPLSDADVEALRALKSFDRITNVFNDANAEMDFIYATTEHSAITMENNKELHKCLQIVSFDAETGTLITKSVDYTG